MKIHSSTRSILATHFFYMLFYTFFIILPLLACSYASFDKAENLEWLGYSLIGVSCIVILKALYSIYQALQKRGTKVLEITQSGFMYPYLLDESIEIMWKDVVNIRAGYGAIREEYILIDVVRSAHLGEKKHLQKVIKSFEAKSKDHVIAISNKIMSDYSLHELYDLLIYRWQKYRKELSSTHQLPEKRNVIRYERSFSLLFHGLAWLLLTLIFSILMSGSLVDMTDYIMFAGLPSLWIILKSRSISELAASYQKPIAIDFDDKGIYQLNQQKYVPAVPWKNLSSIAIQRRNKGRFKEPYLEFLLQDNEGQQQKAVIKNNFIAHGIYELFDDIEKHRHI